MSAETSLAECEAFKQAMPIIQSGSCVLFLGAGVSMDSGAPSGRMLTEQLSKSFFPNEPVMEDLGFASEAVVATYGRKELNEWIVDRLRGLAPKGALLSIPTYHWKSIYTVNFDTLLEEAYEKCPMRQQVPHPFYSNKDSVSRLRAGEVPLYKLHGCISRANSNDGGLVITPEDVALAEESRQRLFNRLIDDVSDYTVLYVGFGRADQDFRKILINVERAAGKLTDIRRSYALQPGYRESERALWDQKRVTLIDAKAEPFFEELGKALPEWARYAPPEQPLSKWRSPLLERYQKLTTSVLDDIETNFEIVDERIQTQIPNFDQFFLGAQPNWSLLATRADARRDLEDEIITSVIRDTHLDTDDVEFILLHAEAGSGKTTLLRRIAVDLALLWEQVVISAKPFGSIDFLPLERLANSVGRRLYLIVDDATAFARELSELTRAARRAKTKLTILAAARTNEWREISEEYEFGRIVEFELKSLSRGEIERIIETLDSHNALGLLAGASEEAKVAAFETRAHKQLLVALREATVGKSFDDIIVDEFNRIPTPEGQRAYLLVASLHRFGIWTRAGLLHRSLQVPLTSIGRKVLEPTQKVIIAHQQLGEGDIYYTTRHPLIANIVFDRKLIADRRRKEFYMELARNFDLGYSSDRDAYRRLTRRNNRELLRDLESPRDRKELMDRLLRTDPSDAYAIQHAAIMELDQNDLEAAAKYIEQAITLAPNDPSIRDTEGRYIRMSAVEESNPLVSDELFARAEDIYKRNARIRPDEPFAYRNLAETYLAWSKKKGNREEHTRYVALAYEALEEGLNRCSSVTMLLKKQAEIEQDVLKDTEKARDIFRTILGQRPTDLASRFLAASLEEKVGHRREALDILREGLDYSGSDPQLHFKIADLMAQCESENKVEIRAHFEAAMLGPIRVLRPRVAYGAFLFSIAEYEASKERFAAVEQVASSTRESRDVYRFQYDGLTGVFEGHITNLTHTAGWVEFSLGATTVYFDPRAVKKDVRDRLSPGAVIRYYIGFNPRGPVALNVELIKTAGHHEVFMNMELDLPSN